MNVIEVAAYSVFAGGYFSTAGVTSAYGIARYDGVSWEAVGGGLMTNGGEIKALLAVGRVGGGYDLYVGGAFAQVGEVGSAVGRP